MYHIFTMWGEKNFTELLIHHIATVFSILFCYFTNFEDYGPFILIASDLSDATLNFAKVFRDIQGAVGRITDVVFGITMLSFFFTRNVFFLGCWYHSIKKFHPFQKVVLKDPKYDHLWYFFLN